MLLSPDEYAKASVGELLRAAARGQIGLDQRWVRAIVDRGPACAPELLAFIREARPEEVFDLEEDVLAIARELACPEVVPVLIELARRHAEDLPDLLVEAFQAVGAPAVEPLLALRQELTDTRELDMLLAGLGVHDSRILEVLLEQLRQDPAEGALLLGLYRDPASRPALEEALARAADEETRNALREAIETLKSREPPVYADPFGILSRYPETATPEFGVLPEQDLLELLASPLAEWRLGAVRELGSRQVSDAARQRLLQLAQQDPDPAVRGASWRAVARVCEIADYQEALLARLSDPSISLPEARGLLLALAPKAEDPAVRRWVLDFYDRPETRAAALEAMWLSGNRRFVPYLREHLDDPDPEARRQAVIGLGWLGARSELQRLSALFKDPQVRSEALQSYALLAPAESGPSGLRRLLRKIEELAGGLSEGEADIIQQAFGVRFGPVSGLLEAALADDEAQSPQAEPRRKVGRNEPCPCGSGKKYKKCCGA